MKSRVAALFAALILVVAVAVLFRERPPKTVEQVAPESERRQSIPEEGPKPEPARPADTAPVPPNAETPVPRSATTPAAPPAIPAISLPSPMPAVNRPPASDQPTTSAPGTNMPAGPSDAEAVAKVVAELDQVGLMLRDYRTRMGENPVGTNAEIMKSVMGENPKGARLGPRDGQRLNEKGELVDVWGTPYFFHQMSRTSMELRSAGPDRLMGTPDDVVQP